MSSCHIQKLYDLFAFLDINNLIFLPCHDLCFDLVNEQGVDELFCLLQIVAYKFQMIPLFGIAHRTNA